MLQSTIARRGLKIAAASDLFLDSVARNPRKLMKPRVRLEFPSFHLLVLIAEPDPICSHIAIKHQVRHLQVACQRNSVSFALDAFADETTNIPR
jgi:hypothetical protein